MVKKSKKTSTQILCVRMSCQDSSDIYLQRASNLTRTFHCRTNYKPDNRPGPPVCLTKDKGISLTEAKQTAKKPPQAFVNRPHHLRIKHASRNYSDVTDNKTILVASVEYLHLSKNRFQVIAIKKAELFALSWRGHKTSGGNDHAQNGPILHSLG